MVKLGESKTSYYLVESFINCLKQAPILSGAEPGKQKEKTQTKQKTKKTKKR